MSEDVNLSVQQANNVQEAKKDKPKKKFILNGIFSRIKKIKHLDVILTVLFIAIILLIYFSTFSWSSSKENKSNANENTSQINTTTLEEYTNKLENKLEKTLSAIKDAGNVSVLIYFSEGIETVIAYTTETTTSQNGEVTEKKSPVLIVNNGKTQTVVLQENMPKPTSIVIVASGASKTNVKLEILRAVQAMFDISTSNVEIFAGN